MGNVLTQASGLSERDLIAIAELERRVVTHDGGRLKLEWETLRGRSGARADDLLWWEGEHLLGFLGLYQFGSASIELVGMVDPAARRSGIGTALVNEALRLVPGRGGDQVLLLAPRSTTTGRDFAVSRGATLEHSEHVMELRDAPPEVPMNGQLHVRDATSEDTSDINRILCGTFGSIGQDIVTSQSPSERLLVVERGGSTVGTVRLSTHGRVTGIYGLAVEPRSQGQGIGRHVLAFVCNDVRSQGSDRVTLEVATTNDRALGLYTSVGFALRGTDDYFLLAKL
jgi:ribosomal protein S18 acetylase RimI-like enzyme